MWPLDFYAKPGFAAWYIHKLYLKRADAVRMALLRLFSEKLFLPARETPLTVLDFGGGPGCGLDGAAAAWM